MRQSRPLARFFLFFFNDTATTEIYTLSLHDALPISWRVSAASMPSQMGRRSTRPCRKLAIMWSTFTFTGSTPTSYRSEEHTSELQSQSNLVCRLLLEKKKKNCV